MKHSFLLLIFCFTLFSCDDTYKTPPEIENINIDTKVKRFDIDFLNTQESEFKKLKTKYPYLVPKNGEVSALWSKKKQDTLVMEQLEQTNKIFPDFIEEEHRLSNTFKHIKFHFPEFKTPEVVTVTSMVDYRNSVLLQGNILLIAIDCYLGPKHHFYSGFSEYISSQFTTDYLVSDVTDVYAKNFIEKGKQRLFIEQMIYFGKILYLKDQFMPFESEAKRIKYTQADLEWANANEGMIWSYFVEQDMLWSTDTKLSNRFLANAPFSKFYLAVDNESPGRLGQYIGWQIVRAFMKKNDVSLRQLCTMSNEEIFRKSKYKPAK